MEKFINKIIQGNCLNIMKEFLDNSIDLIITSPPYDNLRDYQGYSFDFENIAKELFRITKQGGVVVWVVGDATINGSETGTSFKQALYFKEIGFNLHDTMIYEKLGGIPLNHNRYEQKFEYMFIFSKSNPKTFNPILDKTIGWGKVNTGGAVKSGSMNEKSANYGGWGKGKLTKKTKIRKNIWGYFTGKGHSTLDEIAFEHPAIFPEKLVVDHIISWSKEGDVVLDPMCGSGTTCKMAKLLDRNYIGIDISEKYCEIARKRLAQKTLF